MNKEVYFSEYGLEDSPCDWFIYPRSIPAFDKTYNNEIKVMERL